MSVRLEEITIDNYRVVLMLKVAEDQQKFVATNCCSVAQSKFYPSYRPRAIYTGEEPVGFLMYGHENEGDPSVITISRLMIAEAHQRKGYGREALRLAVDEIRNDLAPNRVLICYELENEIAKRVYAEFGFVEIGHDEDGEVIAELRDGSGAVGG